MAEEVRMEFSEAVLKRRIVRRFTDEPEAPRFEPALKRLGEKSKAGCKVRVGKLYSGMRNLGVSGLIF